MEKQIEGYLKLKIRKAGGLCLKLTGYKGIPDRMVLVKGKGLPVQGTVVFIELKDEGKKLRPEQKVWQDRLREMGFVSVMLDSKDAVDEFVKGVIQDG